MTLQHKTTSRGLIALTVMLPTLIEIIDMSIVNVLLYHIRGSLSTGTDEATWTITAYIVSVMDRRTSSRYHGLHRRVLRDLHPHPLHAAARGADAARQRTGRTAPGCTLKSEQG
ncbi:MAG: hypothetical protein OEW15_13185 [Nitrospirota bacterium]|nr:hypothetical protein [Nitrospirota bacterium]